MYPAAFSTTFPLFARTVFLFSAMRALRAGGGIVRDGKITEKPKTPRAGGVPPPKGGSGLPRRNAPTKGLLPIKRRPAFVFFSPIFGGFPKAEKRFFDIF